MPEQHDVVIVGAGFAGVYQLHRLRGSGFDVTLLEAGSDLGGIWHWNCYPGARVDTHVPMYEYSAPELWKEWYWDERFPDWRALRRYFDHVDSVWDVRRDIRFGQRLRSASWDEDGRSWELETADGDRLECRWLLACTGFASTPYVPAFPGLERFRGECHHTARWPQAGLDLSGLRVGVVGVGASGVQVVQEAAAVASQLTVFQRTPILALPMQQRRLTRDEQDRAKADYPERFRLRATTPSGFDVQPCGESALAVTERERKDAYQRLWEGGGLDFWTGTYTDVLRDPVANRTAYEFWRDQVRARVRAPELVELLAPTEPPHPFGVKRPSLEQNYYDVFDQENVSLVDLRQEPLQEITARGIRTARRHVDLDVIVLATGFDAVTGGLTSMGLRGTETTLAASWANGVHSHLGVAASGFPNLLFTYGPQSPSGFCNGPTCAEVQGEMVVNLLDDLRDRGITRLEAQPDAEAAWRGIVAQIAESTLFPRADSWYMGANIPGKARELLNFPGLHIYRELCREALGPDLRGFTAH